jgi:DNA polymerase-1
MVKKLLAADYAQLEVRIAAFMSGDPALTEVCTNDPSTPEGDVHARTMRDVFAIPFEKHKEFPAIRVQAKSYLFGKLYGVGPSGAIQLIEKNARERPDLGIHIPTMPEARRDMNKLANVYSHYSKKWVPWTIEKARLDGYGEDALGGRRYDPDLLSADIDKRLHAERAIVNMAIQGTAAKVMLMAMIGVAKLDYVTLLLQVHDEIVCEIDEKDIDRARQDVVECMSLGQPFMPIPLIVDVGIGDNWRDIHK